jgi:hypothetical protein
MEIDGCTVSVTRGDPVSEAWLESMDPTPAMRQAWRRGDVWDYQVDRQGVFVAAAQGFVGSLDELRQAARDDIKAAQEA